MRVLNLVLCIFLILTTNVYAQQLSSWDLRAASVGSGNVSLNLPNGTTYTTIPRSDAKKIIDIIDKISTQSGIYPERINLIGTNQLNASAGYINGVATINIYKPIFDIFIKDPDIAAFVLGHEMGHLYYNHTGNAQAIQAAGNAVALIAGTLLSIKTGKKYGNPQLGADAGNLLGTAVATSFTRDQERAADKIGIQWAIKLGYDPNGAIRMFSMFEKMGGNNLIPFFQTHPNPRERIDNVRAEIASYSPYNSSNTIKTASTSTSTNTYNTIKTISSPVVNDEITKINALIDEEKINQTPSSASGVAAMQAFAKKDYKSAKINFEKCINEGETSCINNLGVIYQMGLGVAVDYKKALHYYKQAADKGLAVSMYNYALLVEKAGDGSQTENREELFKNIVLAAEKGSPKAMGKVASLSQIHGIESLKILNLPPKDVLITYAKVSAMRGYPEGQAALGSFYINGFGVEKDYDQAETNLLLAAKNEKLAEANLYILYLEDKPDEKKVKEYKKNIIDEKNVPSIALLANKFCPAGAGEAVVDLFSNALKKAVSNESGNQAKECFFWTQAWAYSGNVNAARLHANYLIIGYGTEVNKFEGAAWLVSAMLRGDAKSKERYEKFKNNYSVDDLSKINLRTKEINSMFVKK